MKRYIKFSTEKGTIFESIILISIRTKNYEINFYKPKFILFSFYFKKAIKVKTIDPFSMYNKWILKIGLISISRKKTKEEMYSTIPDKYFLDNNSV